VEYENLVALTVHLSNHRNSYEFSTADYKENKCVVVTESDVEANTRLESIDYDGFYVELGGEKLTRNAI